jgi:primosomal protein N' (replication factor Y) (superfamily II helicase)
MPKVTLIDMRQEFLETRKQATFSRRLIEGRRAASRNREQTIILLNRRGFSSFVACRVLRGARAVRELLGDAHVHRRDRRMLCHYCNYSERVPEPLPQVRQRLYLTFWVSDRNGWRKSCTEFPEGAHRASGSRFTCAAKHDYETVLRLSRGDRTTFWSARR